MRCSIFVLWILKYCWATNHISNYEVLVADSDHVFVDLGAEEPIREPESDSGSDSEEEEEEEEEEEGEESRSTPL